MEMPIEPRYSTPRGRASAIILAGVLVTALTAASGWLAIRRFDALQATWTEYAARATAIGDALAELDRSIGYGGFIHDFKNYVLRRDGARYLERIRADIRGTEAALDKLGDLLRIPADREALLIVRATFAEYFANFELVAPMIEAGASQSEIDAVVKVDDGPALAALGHLAERAEQRARAAETRTADEHESGREYLLAGAAALVLAILAATFTLLRFLGQIADARRRAEEALGRELAYRDDLVRAEKMAALGGLVAGVAHEINTPVGVSLTAATHLDAETGKVARAFEAGELTEEELTEFLDTAREAARLMTVNCERASELTQSFKQVAVDQTGGERRSFAIGDYIEEVLVSLRPHLKKTGVTVTVDCPRELVVDGPPGAFSQVVTNLVMNAVTHAFEPGAEGRVVIAVKPEAGSLTLAVADDGRGIPPEAIGKVFEPFFTTRRGAGGSGLGLHIVHNIVTQSLGGTLRVESEGVPGKGARFIMRLPFSVGELAAGAAAGMLKRVSNEVGRRK